MSRKASHLLHFSPTQTSEILIFQALLSPRNNGGKESFIVFAKHTHVWCCFDCSKSSHMCLEITQKLSDFWVNELLKNFSTLFWWRILSFCPKCKQLQRSQIDFDEIGKGHNRTNCASSKSGIFCGGVQKGLRRDSFEMHTLEVH